MKSSPLLWSNPSLTRIHPIQSKLRHTFFYPFMWAQESHTQPPTMCGKQTCAMLDLNKGDSSQSSTHCRWNWGLSLDSGRGPCDWGSDSKSLNGSYTCEAQEQGSKKSRNDNILSHRCVSAHLHAWICELHALMAWIKNYSIVSEEVVQVSWVFPSHLLLFCAQDA